MQLKLRCKSTDVQFSRLNFRDLPETENRNEITNGKIIEFSEASTILEYP